MAIDEITQREFDKALKLAKYFMAKDGSIDAPLFIGFSDDSQYIIPGHYEGVEQKQRFLQILEMIFLLKRVKFYIILSESWLACRDRSETGKIESFCSPSKDPNRVEAVTVFLGTRNGARIQAYETIRDEGGKFIRLEHYGDFNEVEGRFTELLLPEEIADKMPAELVALLEAYIKSKLVEYPSEEDFDVDETKVQ